MHHCSPFRKVEWFYETNAQKICMHANVMYESCPKQRRRIKVKKTQGPCHYICIIVVWIII
jgi:hypothetical protein